jgi:hypothetical protein
MTKREAAIVSARTGPLIGDLEDYRRYVETLLVRTVGDKDLKDMAVGFEIREQSHQDVLIVFRWNA